MRRSTTREDDRRSAVPAAGRGWFGPSAFRRLSGAVVISELGDWLLFIALPLYVLQASGSALATSTVFLAELVPAVLVGTTCGPLIDRCDPARFLTCLTAVQGVVVLPLLWAGPGQVWLIYAVAAVQAGFTSLTVPAQQAVVPTIVSPTELPRGNAIVEMASNVARLVGSPLGGALLPVIGLHGLVLGDMGSFVISAAMLGGLHTSVRQPEGSVESRRARPLAAIADGGRAVRRSTTLRAAVIISFLAAVAQGLFLVLFVLFVLRSLHAGDQLVGLLRGVQAIGGVLGGVLVAGRLHKSSARALAVCGLAAFAGISALCWNSSQFTTAAWWYVTLFALVGVPATMATTGLITGTQQAIQPHLRGRVLSLLAVAEALGQATGILAAGLLAGVTSLHLLLNAQASCYATCALIAFALFARPRRWPPQRLAHARGS